MNKHQKKFLKVNSLKLSNKSILQTNIRNQLTALYGVKEYRVFSAFKRNLHLNMKKIITNNTQAVKLIINKIKNKHPPYDIGSYITALGIDLQESISIYRATKNKYILDQLLWRVFYYQAVTDDLYSKWVDDLWPVNHIIMEQVFNGQTGYELIDSSVNCLKKTGKMTNRNRMVFAIFFCKNLLQPWYYGEIFFEKYLEDYDKVVNRGNWIWCSQIRFDNQRFIRFMHPDIQLKKLLSTEEGTEWFRTWKMPTVNKIIDWKESCDKYRSWKKELRNTFREITN